MAVASTGGNAAWVEVLPSMAKFLPELQRQVGPPAQAAGRSAGQAFGTAFRGASQSDVTKAASDYTRSMRGVADAAGTVRVAEEKLAALRSSGKATTAQLVSSEEALARARRAQETAQDRVAVSTARLHESQKASVQQQQASNTAMNEGVGHAGRLTNAFGTMRNAVVVGFAAFAAARTAIGFFGDTVRAARDLHEEMNKSQVVFGAAGQQVLDWSKTTAKAMGISQREALGTAGTFGNLFRTMGMTDQTSADMSMRLVQLSSDLASFNNANPTDVLEAMRAGLVGETEPMRRFGVDISDASMRAEALKQGLQVGPVLTQAQKAQLAYSLMLKQTTLAQGDFGRTSDALANSQRILRAEWENSQAQLGQVFLPVITGVVHWLSNTFLPVFTGGFQKAVDTVKLFFGAFTGKGADVSTLSGGWMNTVIDLGARARQIFDFLKGAFTSFVEAFKAGNGDVTSSGLNGWMERLGNAAHWVWDALTNFVLPAVVAVGGWMKDHLAIVAGVVGAYEALRVAIFLNSLFTGGAAFVNMLQWINNLKVVQFATKAWAAAQWLLNSAIWSSPITWIVVGIAALVAGIIYAWNHFEGFRNVVLAVWAAVKNAFAVAWEFIQSVWQGIATGATWLWQNILQPVFGAVAAAWQAMATAVGWVWNNILSPIWTVIRTAAEVIFKIAVVAIFGILRLEWEIVSHAMVWVWQNVLYPAWQAIQTAATWMWENVLRPVWGFIGAAWDVLLRGIQWAWSNILQPTWKALTDAASWVWNAVLAPVFQAIGAAWDGLMRGLNWVYYNVLHPIWEVIKGAVGGVQRAFEVVKEAIATVWNALMVVVAKPINFVIEIVFNRGLFTAWNWVVDHLGLPGSWHAPTWGQIGPPESHWAYGGDVQGFSPTPRSDNVPAMLTAHEYVQPVDAHAFYGTKAMDAVRERRAVIAFQGGGSVPGAMTWADLWSTVHGQFPGSVLTSAYRPGSADWHGRGDAIDIGWPGNAQSGLMPIAAWIAANFPYSTELIHNPNASIKNGSQVAPSFWGASTWAQHANHVHWAMTPDALAQGGGPGARSIFATIGDVWNKLSGSISAIGDLVGKVGNNPFVQMITKVPGALLGQMWDAVKGKIAEFFIGPSNEPTSAAGATGYKEIARSLLYSFGWNNAAQFNAVDYLFSHESGWNPKAKNPSSSASGVAQMIDGTWRAYRGIADGRYARAMDAPFDSQVMAAYRYIRAVYGDPQGATSWWATHGYYGFGGPVSMDRGGLFRNGMLAANTSGFEERVLSHRQDRWFEHFRATAEDLLDGMAGGGSLIDQVNLYANDRDQGRDIIERLWHRLRVADRGGRYTSVPQGTFGI